MPPSLQEQAASTLPQTGSSHFGYGCSFRCSRLVGPGDVPVLIRTVLARPMAKMRAKPANPGFSCTGGLADLPLIVAKL